MRNNSPASSYSLRLLIIILFIISALAFLQVNQSTTKEQIQLDLMKQLGFSNPWHECVERRVEDLNPEKLWNDLPSIITACRNSSGIPADAVKSFQNKDETKFGILSRDDATSTFLSIGIGKDITGEQAFQKVQPNTKFYGADPIIEANDELYSTIGEFFPFAVGSETKKSMASVLLNGSYHDKLFFHMDILIYVKYILKKIKVDHLWLDAEGAEYGILPFFHRNEEFDKEGLLFCQVNGEVHRPNEKQKQIFADFIKLLAVEQRYVILESSIVYGHNRFYFVNVEHPYCRQKFLRGHY